MNRILTFLILLLSLRTMAGEQATAEATLTAGFVTGITVTFGGSGYTSKPAVTISGGGGTGAVAKAILNGDKVALVIVWNAGSGYTGVSVVTIEPPPKALGLGVRLVPEITVYGPPGEIGQVEWSPALGSGSVWQTFTNVTLGTVGTVVVDLAAGSATRFYRASTTSGSSVGISFVTVGDAGNAADPTGFKPMGAVGYAFQIQKFEFTNAEYVDFLNAVGGTNPNGIYSSSMSSEARGGITQAGASPNFTYAVKANMGDKPVNYVSRFEAARVANWLHNGRSTNPALLETGAYTLNDETFQIIGFNKNAGATYWVPSDDEWYKAAYYKGGGLAAGYWAYPTKSDTEPTYVTASPTGVGSAGLGSTANSINGNLAADWNSQDGNVTTVGSNGGPSAYGTFDMGGNVWEWDDGVTLNLYRVIRGGGWDDFAVQDRSVHRGNGNPVNRDGYLGFRLARSSVP